MGGYTATGPFSDNSAPGIDHNFLNNIENWIKQLEGTTGSVSISGQTSGTVTLYQVLQGTFKKCILILDNYKNTGNQYITLPTAFTKRAWFDVGDTGGGHLGIYTGGSGGSVVNCMIATNLAAGGGTAAGPQSYISYYSVGQINGGFDTIQFQVNSSAANGIMIIEGV